MPQKQHSQPASLTQLANASLEATDMLELAVSAQEGEKPKFKSERIAEDWLGKHAKTLDLLRTAARNRKITWVGFCANLPENRDARTAELFERVKAEPKLQGLTEKAQKLLAHKLDEAWTDLRNMIFGANFQGSTSVAPSITPASNLLHLLKQVRRAKAVVVIYVSFVVASLFCAPWEGWGYVPEYKNLAKFVGRTTRFGTVLTPPANLYGEKPDLKVGAYRLLPAPNSVLPPRLKAEVLFLLWGALGILTVAVVWLDRERKPSAITANNFAP